MKKKSFKFDFHSHVPLYRQLEHRFIVGIRRKEYLNGEALPSINVLNQSLPLSRVTIVQALKSLVKDGFAIARPGKGYYVKAPVLENTLGVVAPFHSAHIGIYANLLAGLRHFGVRAIFRSSDENLQHFMHSVDELINYEGLSAMVIVPPYKSLERNEEKSLLMSFLMKRQVNHGVRFAVIDREIGGDYFQIRQDRGAGIKLFLERAKELKSRKIVIFSNELRLLKSVCRYPLVDEFGKRLLWKHAEGAEKDLQFIRENEVDTVLAAEDIHARNLVTMLGSNYGNLKIAGYNGTPIALCMKPIITTVNSNLAEAGEIAAKYLLNNEYQGTRELLVQPFIVPGETM